jgi:hypothetical protein
MRPLKSHFPVHALTTLDTLLKQAGIHLSRDITSPQSLTASA